MRWLRFACPILVAVVIGCGGKANPATGPTPADKAPALTGYALVWNDAWLTDGAAGAKPNRARYSDDTSRAVGDVFVMKIVADHGATLELENVPTAERERHCHAGLLGLDTVALRVVVARGDLAPTTPRDVTVGYEDGTSVTLRAGVALGAATTNEDPRTHAVLADGVRLALRLADEKVGFAYAPSVALDADDQAALGETMVAQDAELRFGGTTVESHVHPLQVTKQVATPAGTLVTLPLPCIELTALVAPEKIGSDSWIEAGIGVGAYATHAARADAPIYWTDGRVAGRTVALTPLLAFDDDPEHGIPATMAGRPCYWLRVREPDGSIDEPGIESSLRVCFDAADVIDGPP